jgi:hypothetical protein
MREFYLKCSAFEDIQLFIQVGFQLFLCLVKLRDLLWVLYGSGNYYPMKQI